MKAPQKKRASKSHPNTFGKQKHGGPPRPSSRGSTDNPFDKIANARKKHDVLNRRVKGEDRNVGRARSKVRSIQYIYLLLRFKTTEIMFF